MKSIVLEGTLRTENGKKAANHLRKAGEVLCNLYGGEENVMFSAPYNSFNPIVYSPDFYQVEVKLDGKSYTALVKDIQYHPVTDQIQHIDFLELVPGKIVVAEIPIVLVGQAAGVKAGGKLVQKLRCRCIGAFYSGQQRHDISKRSSSQQCMALRRKRLPLQQW